MSSGVRVLVTGAQGFIGRNLVVALRRAGVDVCEIDRTSTATELAAGLASAAVVFHLAGVNRSNDDSEFQTGNVEFLERVISASEKTSGRPTVVFSSSTHVGADTPYGRSKAEAEAALESYARRTGAPAIVYRLPGVFGKWARPNYNSVIATFCHNVARDLPITISDPARSVDIVYVDDVVRQFLTHIERGNSGLAHRDVQPVFTATLGDLAAMIRGFRAMRESLLMPDTSDPFTSRLLATYTSYLPPSDLAYALQRRRDERGALAELVKSRTFGQIFVSRTRPGMIRGNHYHDAKVEKFCVLDGDAVIRFRSILGDKITAHRVSGSEFKVVDIPPGMTHSIENVGTSEMIVLFWASEIFEPERPDTYFEKVQRD